MVVVVVVEVPAFSPSGVYCLVVVVEVLVEVSALGWQAVKISARASTGRVVRARFMSSFCEVRACLGEGSGKGA